MGKSSCDSCNLLMSFGIYRLQTAVSQAAKLRAGCKTSNDGKEKEKNQFK